MEKRIVSILLAVILVMSTVLTGCGKSEKKNEQEASNNGGTSNVAGTEAGRDLITLEVYDVAANYQGIANGWFANYVKNKFNIEFNIIAPQASGDASAVYQTRSSSGKMGDIILLDNSDFVDCMNAGLIKDISGLVDNYPNITVFKDQIKAFANQVEGKEGAIYGIPSEMTNTSPTTYSQTSVLSSPWLPWDYYKELGTPEMKDLSGLLDVLEAMQKAHPTNKDGDKAYAIGLWPSWDNTSIENVNQMTKWYGEEVNGSVLLNAKGEMRPLTEDAGSYHKMLRFLFDANQRGLIDPDSATQDWNIMLEKMKAKRVYLYWYNWSLGFYNTVEKTSKGDGYIYAPIEDMNFYQVSDSYFGSGRVWGIGSQVDDATALRIMEFLDWYASPEGVNMQNVLLKDFTYEVRENGTFKTINDTAVVNNDIVPDEYGGGPIIDGMNQLNQWIVGALSINPDTGESYSRVGWSSEKEKEKTTLEKEWIAHYNTTNALELMKSKNQLEVVPSVNLILKDDSTDIALVRSQCGKLICDYSWQMIYASDEAAFEKYWTDLKEKLTGLGWDKLVEADRSKYQPVVEERAKSLSK